MNAIYLTGLLLALPEVGAGLVEVWLEGLARHEHDVLGQASLHDHVPGGGQARHLQGLRA